MLKLKIATTLITASAIAAGAATAAPADPGHAYGGFASQATSKRTIAITPSTTRLNVTDGETVTFAAEGKSFTWHVAIAPNMTVFDLADIAPAGLATHAIKVYVAPNPAYFGG